MAREAEIVALVAEDSTTRRSPNEFLSPSTARTHVSRAMVRLAYAHPGSLRNDGSRPRHRPALRDHRSAAKSTTTSYIAFTRSARTRRNPMRTGNGSLRRR